MLHHPEHGHAVVLPIISCIIDGTLVYDRTSPPFASFISLVCPSSEVWPQADKCLHFPNSLSFLTDDFLLDKLYFCHFFLQVYIVSPFSFNLSNRAVVCFSRIAEEIDIATFSSIFIEWVLWTVGSGMWGDLASFNSLQSPNIQDGTAELWCRKKQ